MRTQSPRRPRLAFLRPCLPVLMLLPVALAGCEDRDGHIVAGADAQALLAEALRAAGEQRHGDAIEIFERVKAERPEAIAAIHGLKFAVVLYTMGEAERFDAHCRWLIARYRNADTATDAERSVKGYLLFPGPHDPALLAHADKMTAFALESSLEAGDAELLPWFYVSRGMAQYRMGNFEEAVESLARSADDKSLYIRSLAQAFYAMAEHGRGNDARALALLEKARATRAELPAPGTDEYNEEWTDTLMAHLAMREAEEVIGGALNAQDGGSHADGG